MPHQLNCRVSNSTWAALRAQVDQTGDSLSHLVEKAVASSLDVEHHSIFQVSTSGALVEGVYQGCTRVRDLKAHGDFGLGTYENLDGELVMLEGRCYRATASGETDEADDAWPIPFATVTHFESDQSETLYDLETIEYLEQQVDTFRPSQNIFMGVRLDGLFEEIELRAACKAEPGEDLVTATSHQSQFSFENVRGTLLGFWTPSYATALNVAGYHLHFISDDRTKGGHLLNLKARELRAQLHFETDFHMAIPETTECLEADLRGDPSAALRIAEKSREKR